MKGWKEWKEACCWGQLLKNSPNWCVITRRRRARLDEEGGCRQRVFGIRGRFVLPPSRAFQQCAVEVQPAETNCFCASAAANFGIKLSTYIWLNFPPANTPGPPPPYSSQLPFHFNASHLPSPPLSCGGISPRLLLPCWSALTSYFFFYSPSSSVTNLTFWILVGYFLKSQCCINPSSSLLLDHKELER